LGLTVLQAQGSVGLACILDLRRLNLTVNQVRGAWASQCTKPKTTWVWHACLNQDAWPWQSAKFSQVQNNDHPSLAYPEE